MSYIHRLSREEIIILHDELIEQYGGTYGIRDEKLLDSAISAPFQTFDGIDLYPSLIQKAIHLSYNLVHDHPFIDGNKRIGAHTLLVFLKSNGILLNVTDNDIANFFWGLASGEKTSEDLLNWVMNHL